jgi:hypothetical protein
MEKTGRDVDGEWKGAFFVEGNGAALEWARPSR